MNLPYTLNLCLLSYLFFFVCISSLAANPGHKSDDPILFQIASTEIVKSEATNADVYLKIEPSVLQDIMRQRAAMMSLNLPIGKSKSIVIDLEKKRFLTSDFKVSNRSISKKEKINYEAGVYYQGKVEGFPNSLVALSFFDDQVMGVISFNGENYNLGVYTKGAKAADDIYILYPESTLLEKPVFNCHVPDVAMDMLSDAGNSTAKAMTENSVKIYFECDYKMYLDNGSSVANTTDFVTAMFNVVAAVYAIDDICVELSEIMVWTTDDPYPSLGADAALDAFQEQLNGNFNGDVAQLLSTVSTGNGGLAYLDVLCDNYSAVSYSNIDNDFLGLPSYSWSVGVIAHELGHNFGSPHTHSCSWPGGAIDNCFCPESACDFGPEPAATGGTIMSYCHLGGGNYGNCEIPTPNPGVNLNTGFGPLPAALIINNIENANCLTACGSPGGGGGSVLDCTNAIELNNGITYTGNTNEGIANITFYGCADYQETGKEVVHFFTAPLTGTATIYFSENVAGYIDLFVLGDCDPNNCITFFDGDTDVSGFIDVTEGETYYFITDVYTGGAGGAYDLTVFFPVDEPLVVTFTEMQESCYGENDGAIDLSVVGGSSGYTFQWSHGAVTEDVSNLAPGVYSCTITDSNGSSQSTGNISISAAPQMAALISTPNNIDCNNEQIVIDATTSVLGTAVSTSWSTSDGNIVSGVNTLLLLVDQPGTYNLTLMYNNDPNCIDQNSVLVLESSFPFGTINTTAENGLNADGTATVEILGGEAPFTYLWNTTPVQTTPTATGLSAGNYLVQITDANGCLIVLTAEVGQVTNATEIIGLNQFQLYPNPSTGFVNVLLGFEKSETADLHIYDVLGRSVWHKSIAGTKWQETIDLSALPNSVYMVTLVKGKKQITQRLMLHQ